MTAQLTTIDHETGEILPVKKDRAYYATTINGLVSGMVEAIIETGQILIEAKVNLKHGEFIPMIEEDLPFGVGMAENFMRIARNEVLSNSQHVANLPPAIGTLAEVSRLPDPEIITRLESGELNPETKRSDVTGWIRNLKQSDIGEPAPWPAGKYAVIYADPPWSYDNSGFDQSASHHYPTMTIDDLCALPISDLAGEPSVLFMWATVPLLPEALRVLEAWGFEYKTHRVWEKDKGPSIGWWMDTRHELLLIGTFGGNHHPSEKLPSVVFESAGRHSQKPDRFRKDIEAVYDGPYIELFARQSSDGWDVWGNQ